MAKMELFANIQLSENGARNMKYNRDAYVKVFEDLDNYRDFCRDYGHVFNEKHLYNHSTAWGQYVRLRRGERVLNNWQRDSRPQAS